MIVLDKQEEGLLGGMASVPDLLFETLSLLDHPTLGCVRLVSKQLTEAVIDFARSRLSSHPTWLDCASPRLRQFSYFQLWVGQGRCLQTMKWHASRVGAVVELQDGRLAGRANDSTIKIWDAAKGTCEQTLEANGGTVNWCASMVLLHDQSLVGGLLDNPSGSGTPLRGSASTY